MEGHFKCIKVDRANSIVAWMDHESISHERIGRAFLYIVFVRESKHYTIFVFYP